MMNKKIDISFVVPAYNEEKFIGNCLNSILTQAKKSGISFEIIVVNNCSTDKTEEVVLNFPEVKLVREPKKGLTFARQAGFLESRGWLIANLDADTILPDGWIKTVLDEFSKNKNLVALSGPQVYYDVPKNILIEQKIFYQIAYLSYLINKHILNKSSLLQGGNFIIRRDALLKVGGFNTNILFWGEDTDIAKRLHKVGDVKFTFRLPIYASGRRILKDGKFKTAWRYVINYFYVIFFDKPFHKEIEIVSNYKNLILGSKILILGKFNRININLEEQKLKLLLSSGLAILIIAASYFAVNYFENEFNTKLSYFKAEIVNLFKK